MGDPWADKWAAAVKSKRDSNQRVNDNLKTRQDFYAAQAPGFFAKVAAAIEDGIAKITASMDGEKVLAIQPNMPQNEVVVVVLKGSGKAVAALNPHTHDIATLAGSKDNKMYVPDVDAKGRIIYRLQAGDETDDAQSSPEEIATRMLEAMRKCVV